MIKCSTDKSNTYFHTEALKTSAAIFDILFIGINTGVLRMNELKY